MTTGTKDNPARQTIFLVDDDLTNLMVGKKALADTYEVFTLNSAALLFKMLEKSRPDLILLDVAMPEMSGYEAIKILKADKKTAKIPVIFLTAQSDDDNELQGLTLGAIDYITKPFLPPLLSKRIEVHLLVNAQRQELEAQNHKLETQTRVLKSQREKLAKFNTRMQEMVDIKSKTVIELRDALLKTMAGLVEFRDDITGGHIERTQSYLELLLNALIKNGTYDFGGGDVKLILQSAQLHDVGKIAIKDSILNKPGKLTPEEFEEIKKHTTFGGMVIDKIMESTTEQAFLQYAKIFATTHHERWDGKGYPCGLTAENIPLLGRLMAIADVYDALRSDRPYKKAFSHDKAVKIIIDGRGTQFDPLLVDMFEGIADEFDRITMTLSPKKSQSAGGR